MSSREWATGQRAGRKYRKTASVVLKGEGAQLATTAIDPKHATAISADVDAKRSARAVNIACRVLDVILSSILLVVLMPLMAVIAVGIRIDSPGPILFRQRRLGRALSPFTVHKFRTMRDGASDEIHRAFVTALIAGVEPERDGDKPQFKLTSDRRITSIGRFLRRSSLDELPQLWDVLRGKMSLRWAATRAFLRGRALPPALAHSVRRKAGHNGALAGERPLRADDGGHGQTRHPIRRAAVPLAERFDSAADGARGLEPARSGISATVRRSQMHRRPRPAPARTGAFQS